MTEALLEVTDLIKHYPVRAGVLRRQERRDHLAVRRHREQRLPAAVARKPPNRVVEAGAIESGCGDCPDACREPALGASGTRALGHHDEAGGVCSAGSAARFVLTHKVARARA